MTIHFRTPDDCLPAVAVRRRDARRACQGIAADVAGQFGVPVASIFSGSRRRPHVAARHEVMRRLRAMGFSLTDIGRALGRDHTTVLQALNKPEARQ